MPPTSQALLTRYQDAFFLTFALGAASIALRPNASIIPLIITLTGILFYSHFVFRQPHHGIRWRPVALCFALSGGTALSKIHASLSALSNLGVSIFTLTLGSLLTSSCVVLVLYLNTKASTRLGSPWSQLTLFPVLWATIWSVVAHLNPVGYLFTWNVANNNDVYSWLVPILGPAGKDWLVGAWAILASQLVGAWYIGPLPDEEEEENPFTSPGPSTGPKTSAKTSQLCFATLLVGLIIPSLFIDPLPLSFSDLKTTTPVSVACILPIAEKYKHHTFSLDDFISESEKFRASARVLLWPEGAVSFDNATHRDAGFAKILSRLPGPVIGVSFEETVPQEDSGHQRVQKRTGIALLSHDSMEPHFIYYKRNLVPVAESFSLIPSTNPPPLFDAPLTSPRGTPKPDWGPPPFFTRPLPVTASICLDFAFPAPFASLDTKPGLILAPARTWDHVVGRAMWLQAKQRAEELDTHLLWCDGGDGGMSGLIGPGMGEIQQVGHGSFSRTFGLEYPFEESGKARSLFARIGTYWVISLFWVLAVGPRLLLRHKFVARVHALGTWGVEAFKERRRRRALAAQENGQNGNYGTLIDAD